MYLNKLDQYIKHQLKAKYYIRYVDDFVILHNSRRNLDELKTEIDSFLNEKLQLRLHPEKTKILILKRSVGFLGLRIFPHHKLLKKSNIRKFTKKILAFKKDLQKNVVEYNTIYDSLESWINYIKQANTFNLKYCTLASFEHLFIGEISSKDIGRWLKTKNT